MKISSEGKLKKSGVISSHKKTFEMKAAHKRILLTLSKYHLLTADLIVLAVGSVGSATTVKVNLHHLTDAGFIHRRLLATEKGNSPYIYTLTSKGLEYLEETYEMKVGFFRQPSEWDRFSSEWLLHPLELNKFILSANLVGKLISLPNSIHPVIVESWEHDFTLKSKPLTYLDDLGKPHGAIADALITFGIDKQKKERRKIPVWVELERNHHREKAFKEKFRDIHYIGDKGIFNGAYPNHTLKVCFVSTVDAEHVEKMRRWSREELQRIHGYVDPRAIHNLTYYYGVVPHLQGDPIALPDTFLSPYWQHPFDPEGEQNTLHPLIKL